AVWRLDRAGRDCAECRCSALGSGGAVPPKPFGIRQVCLFARIQLNDIARARLSGDRLLGRPKRQAEADCRRHAAPELLPALVLSGRSLGRFQVLGASLSGDCCREIGKLLCLQRKKLIGSLARLQGAGRALAGGDERRHLGAIGVEITDHRSLHPHGILKACNRVLPTDLRIRDQRLVRGVGRCRRVRGGERAIDLLDVERDALGLGEQLLRTLD
ncbi:hypothetical protein chiPu_0029329, partial [Chiloscyllium punctatum]|nr:hypothetical protein [Chiloscyllium punctatum]